MAELWVFKHAPKTLDEYICTDEFKQVLQKIIDDVPNCLLYGPPGCGKGAFVSILAKTTGYDVLQLNASDEAGIASIRDKVKPFSYAASFQDYKLVYLNECDRLTPDAQEMLRALMEDVQASTRFILVANDISGIHEALLSRCALQVNFATPDTAGIAKYVMRILKRESITVDENAKKDIIKVIKTLYPDIRRIIGTLQASVINGKISNIINTSDALLKEIADASIVGDIDSVRTLLRNNNIRYAELYGKLFDRVDEFAHPGNAIIEIAEGVWRDRTIANKEINYLATLCKIVLAG